MNEDDDRMLVWSDDCKTSCSEAVSFNRKPEACA